MRVTFLGTGTSQGVPLVGCECPVCRSTAAENKRWRPSIGVELDGRQIVIDTSPEFRLQMLQYNLRRLDALLFTHPHADHIFGFDDIRRFNQMQRQVIPVYASASTLSTLRTLFNYAFDLSKENWAVPRAEAHEISAPFTLFGHRIEPLLVYHGCMPVTGFRIGRMAYITDCSHIPQETMDKLHGLDVLILDALRYRVHSTHFSIAEAVACIQELRPERAYLTHLCHEVDHHELARSLPPGIAPAYDGLVIDIPDCG